MTVFALTIIYLAFAILAGRYIQHKRRKQTEKPVKTKERCTTCNKLLTSFELFYGCGHCKLKDAKNEQNRIVRV